MGELSANNISCFVAKTCARTMTMEYYLILWVGNGNISFHGILNDKYY